MGKLFQAVRLLSTLVLQSLVFAADNNSLTVSTNTGKYVGLLNASFPNVRQFLKIPYALPPIGNRRWLPPAAVTSNSTTIFDATIYPPSCAQYIPAIPNAGTEYVPQILNVYGSQNTTAGQYAETTAEDCLYLAIWTPTGNLTNLPVIVWLPGGGFVFNGIDVPMQIPSHWVQRTQRHIVVSVNWRLNIFGFPNAKGLSTQNLGLHDQRMALEWVRDNIEAFGGNPQKITLWGESAGAMSTDYQNFAFPSDPIVKGFVMSSGSAFLPPPEPAYQDTTQTNFSFVATHFGCGSVNSSDELACMRKISVADLENFVGNYQDNSTLVNTTQPPIGFTPVPDGQIFFANYTGRYVNGNFSKLPAIFATNADEGSLLVPYPLDPLVMSENQTLANAVTTGLFVCPAANTSVLRTSENATTYRYQYAGNFSNISPLWWLGAYHTSDLQLIFGTHQDYLNLEGMGSTSLEFATSYAMQDHILAFMDDPENGPRSLGWPTYAEGGMLRFGADGLAIQNVTIDSVDGYCYGKGPYVWNP